MTTHEMSKNIFICKRHQLGGYMGVEGHIVGGLTCLTNIQQILWGLNNRYLITVICYL